MKVDSIKLVRGGGMDANSANEYVDPNDWIAAYNFRVTGTGEGEEGNGSNPESTLLISQSLPPGINKGIGGGSFEDVGLVAFFRYNSAGFNQIVIYNAVTKTEQVIYTDKTDSDGKILLPLDPRNYVKAILINETYMIWVAAGLEVGYTNLNTLMAGGYGTVLGEDLSLLKPQCLIPITGVYGSDPGQPANYLYGNLPQFNVQYVNADFNYSAWSTWSKRIVPYQQNTPTLGSDVTQNNYIIVSVNIGSIRATTINIACRFALEIFAIVKSVDRANVVALPNTTVDVSTEIYEAYDPSTNIYSFAFYNNDISIPVDPTQTDLAYDYIWPTNAIGLLNGNIAALSDLQVGYERPVIDVTIGAIGYNPNIDIPAGTYPDELRITSTYPGSSGSGEGDHKRRMEVQYTGIPHTDDVLIIVMADIRNASATISRGYTVPSSQDGNLVAVLSSFAALIGDASLRDDSGDATIVSITFVGPPYYGLQSATVQLKFTGATVSNSIPTELDNTVYQFALSLRDGPGGRFFPLVTGNNYIVQTPSYAQVNGQAIQVTWTINNPVAPVGTYDYQWMTTKPPVTKVLDVLASVLVYKGPWDAHTNTPTLAVNVGTVGHVYQITTPSLPTDSAFFNLGSGGPYNTGDYVVYNGQSWDVLPKSFGDLTSTGNILAFSLNPLNLFNSQYADLGVNTVLSYDFAPGDRCTLHYYIDGSTKVFINNPCVNLSVFGYDSGTYIVKVEKSATFDASVLNDKNTFLRLYSPAKRDQTVSTTQNGTVWYEIGERFTITDGIFDVLTGTITDGGAYYKTRQFDDALLPYSSPPIEVLANDLNYSDFYISDYSSFGRPRTYYDELEKTERKAITITSQPYILGSKNNGLTRYYPANVYGETNGQTSSSFGAIQVTYQRGNVFVIIQEQNIYYVPVNEAYQILNDQLTGVAISEKLLNNGRYETKGIGVGLAKEAFCSNENWACIIDPHRSEPFEVTMGGVDSISGKMSSYFKKTFALAYSQGKKIVLFYNRYYDEVMCCIETDGGILVAFPFSTDGWNTFDNYVLTPSDITPENGTHSTVSYDDTTGLATYTPDTNYVGNDVAVFTFDNDGNTISKNVCLNWIAGNTTVNAFAFTPFVDQPLSTVENSNTILISGPDVPVPISITGGQYAINGGSWTSLAGMVNNGDIVQVRQTSSASELTQTDTTLTISATSGVFSVTTGTTEVDSFTFTSVLHQPLSTEIESNTITVSGNTLPAPIMITGGEYSVNGGAYTNVTATVNSGDMVKVRVLSSSSPNTLTSTTLQISTHASTFSATTKVAVVINYSNTQQASPYVDSNLQIKANGVIILDIYTNLTGTVNCLEGDSITCEATGIDPSTGTTPILHENIKKDGVTIFDQTEPNTPPPTVSILGSFTAVLGSVYTVEADASSGGTPGYAILNHIGLDMDYNIYDGSGALTSSAILNDGDALNIETLITGGDNSEIRFLAPADGRYDFLDVPSGDTGFIGPVTTGSVILDYTVADIAAEVAAGNAGRVVTLES